MYIYVHIYLFLDMPTCIFISSSVGFYPLASNFTMSNYYRTDFWEFYQSLSFTTHFNPTTCRSGAACCSVLQCVAVYCSLLQCIAVCCRVNADVANRTLPHHTPTPPHAGVLQCIAVRCSVLKCVAVCCSNFQRLAVCCSVLQCVAVCCSVLQRVAVCCSLLQ